MKNNIIKSKLLSLVMIGICLSSLTVHASGKSMSNETKEEYYQEYLSIADEISKTSNIPIKVIPIEEMGDEHWIAPEEFKRVVSTTAESIKHAPATEAIVFNASMPRSVGSATKNTTVSVNSGTYTISITGTFNTQYNSTTGRQQFSSTSGISSSINGNNSWRQTSYDVTFIDGYRTAAAYVTGYVRPSGSSTEYLRTCNVEFYCSENGSIG